MTVYRQVSARMGHSVADEPPGAEITFTRWQSLGYEEVLIDIKWGEGPHQSHNWIIDRADAEAVAAALGIAAEPSPEAPAKTPARRRAARKQAAHKQGGQVSSQ